MNPRRRGYTIAEWLLIIALAGLILTALRWYGQTVLGSLDFTMTLAVSPDGQTVASGFYDGRIEVWNANRKRWAVLGRHPVCITQVVFSPDGQTLAATAIDGSVSLWDMATGKLKQRVIGQSPARSSIAFAPDGKSLAVAPPVGPIEIRDAATGRVSALINQAVPSQIMAVAFMRGGKALATMDFAGGLTFYNVALGKPDTTIAPLATSARTMAVASDGETLAISTIGPGPSYDVFLFDFGAAKIALRKRLSGFKQPVWSLSFAPDGRTLLTAANELRLWDAAGGNLRVAVKANPPPMLAAFAPKRATLFTSTFDGVVQQRDASTLRTIATIRSSREAGPALPYFVAGFLTWVVVWAIVRNRRKRVCSECGRKFIATDKRPLVLCRSCYQRSLSADPAAAGRSRGMRRAVIWLSVVVFLLLWNSLFLRRGPAGAMWALWSIVLLVLAAAVFFVFLVLLLVLRMRWAMKRLSHEPNSLRLARKVSGREGVLERFEPITLWSSGEESAAPLVRGCLEQCKRRLEILVGERFEPREPLRILAFEKREQFKGYCRGLFINPGNLDGFYQNAGHRTILFSREAEPYRIAYPERILSTTLAYYFLESKKGHFPPVWLNSGIGYAAGSDDTRDMQARLNRKMLAALERGSALGVTQLFQLKARDLFRMVQNKAGHAQFARFVQWSSQALSVVQYLAGPEAPAERRTRFHAFVNSLEKRDRHADVFEHHFGFTYEQLLQDWQAWVRRQGPGQHELPPDAVLQALCERIIPIAGDPLSRISDRVTAIREMGRNGYAIGADSLIELLRQREQLLKRDAVWALESISGRALGEDVAAWDAWWATLPLDVRGHHEPMEYTEPGRSGTGLPA